jgi:hypothetical protein
VPVEEHWQDAPEAHDFPAAADYLSLLAPASEVTKVVDALRAAETVHYEAKDLLRASRLGLLPPDNVHVRKDLEKVAHGKRLSPVLIVRGRADKGVPLTVADGYHRICASHHLDEDAAVPCRLVAWP